MDMELNSQSFIGICLWLLLSCSLSYAIVQDITCLKSVKASLEDPFGYLSSSWNFNNDTEGYICKFTGVECWHPDENKVLNLRLADMGLKGEFPAGLAYCNSMTGLDLSRNKLSGTLPANISKIVGYLTTLGLELCGKPSGAWSPLCVFVCLYFSATPGFAIDSSLLS